MVLALWVLVWANRNREAEMVLVGVPAGEVLVSLGSIGLVAALTLSGILDANIAGTMLGAHVGYHAAAACPDDASDP